MAYGGIAKAHYETLYKHLGGNAKTLISEASELEDEYKDEVSSLNTKKN